MPRNWLNWILERENKEVGKSEANDKITSCEVTQNQETEKIENGLRKNDRGDERSANDGSSNRNSFVSIDSGIYSDISDFDLSDEIEDECVTVKLRDWLQKIRHQRKPPSLPNNVLDNACESFVTVTKADPYFEEKEIFWAGGFDKERRYHGKGVLTFSDEGFISGTWSHGVR